MKHGVKIMAFQLNSVFSFYLHKNLKINKKKNNNNNNKNF